MKRLAKYHHTLAATNTGGIWDIDELSNGWSQPSPNVFVSSTYFDLAGIAMDEKTLFPQGIALQEPGSMQGAGAGGQLYIVYDLMTTVPIDFDDLASSPTPITVLFGNGFGFPGGYLEYDQVIYGRTRTFAMNIDMGGAVFLKTSDEQYGSMSPTASDRVYSYRVVISGAGVLAPATLYIPPGRHLIEMDAKAEPDFQYLMRLKRSYDLAQSYDED